MGISDPAASSLSLLTLASEENILHLWATLPNANAVNDNTITNNYNNAGQSHKFALDHNYRWASLGQGICPNGSQPYPTSGNALNLRAATPQYRYVDTDLTFSANAEPNGTAYAFHNNNLFWLWAYLFGQEADEVSEIFSFMDNQHPPLPDGQVVTYTIYYDNQALDTATGISLTATSFYALRLPTGVHAEDYDYLNVILPDIPAGMSGTLVITGLVDVEFARTTYYKDCLLDETPGFCEIYLSKAGLDIKLYDPTETASGLPIEWL